jgi:hypothetical protein
LSVRLRFFPAGVNNPAAWKRFDRTLALQNWRFIKSVHDAMTYEHITVDKYDLGNEGISSGNKPALTYASYIWRQYTAAFGANDTVGFSLVCDKDCAANFAAFPSVYGPAWNFPPVFDLHIYGQCGDGYLPTARDEYVAAADYTATKGWTQGWIIGETCYDDGETANLLAAAHNELPSQVLFYIQQWPYYFNKVIDVPYEYSAYSRQGF